MYKAIINHSVWWLYSSCIHGLNKRLVMSKTQTLIFPHSVGNRTP